MGDEPFRMLYKSTESMHSRQCAGNLEPMGVNFSASDACSELGWT